MSDEKPSPGPWRWDKNAGLVDANGASLLPVYIGNIDYEARAKPADARLIAAAPEMAELLREAAQREPMVMDECGMLPPKEWCYACRRRALLARLGR